MDLQGGKEMNFKEMKCPRCGKRQFLFSKRRQTFSCRICGYEWKAGKKEKEGLNDMHKLWT
jgi:ribosomal protein S27AE